MSRAQRELSSPCLCAADVPAWLKSLRLHKYAALFSQMTYEEMMALTECQLEAQVRPTSACKGSAAVPAPVQSVDETPPAPLFASSRGRRFARRWLQSKQRKAKWVLGSEKTHTVPEKGLVPDFLLESQRESPITGSCAWVFVGLGLSLGVQGHSLQYPAPLKPVGLWWPIALLTFENVPAFRFTSALSSG